MDPVISGRGADPVYRDNKGKELKSVFLFMFLSNLFDAFVTRSMERKAQWTEHMDRGGKA